MFPDTGKLFYNSLSYSKKSHEICYI